MKVACPRAALIKIESDGRHPWRPFFRSRYGEQFVEHDTEAKDVGTPIDAMTLSARLLGTHVRRCARVGRPCAKVCLAKGQAEIGDMRLAGFIEKNITRLDIPMNDAPRMSVIQGFRGDCHEPHGSKLRAPGDGVCLQCHAANKYETPMHHRHDGVNPPLTCASCHMPTHTYMVIDNRHDHSIRVPRPDVSAELGTPNAAAPTRADKFIFYAELRGFQRTARKKDGSPYSNGWAAQQFKTKYGSFPPWDWNNKPATDPSLATLRWIKSRQIAWAKARNVG